MKIRLLIFALLLAFAVPAGGADGTWTNGVGDQNWADAGNWSGVAAPGDGETATFDGNETDAELPAANQPGAGTIHFVFTGAYDFFTGTQSIEVDILGSAGAAIGTIAVNNAAADIVPGANFGAAGTGATLTDGYLTIVTGPRTCTGDIVNVADHSGWLYISPGVTLAVSGGTVEMQANTRITLEGAAVLDLAEPMRMVGDGNHRIYFNDGDIYGGIDASSDGTSRQVTVSNVAGAGANLVQAGVTGDLDLGTDGAGGLADWSAVALFVQTGTVTMAADANVYRLTVISGELVGAAKTITADAGGFTFVDGTISGTLDVDLSGSTGAYAQMDGEIAAAAVLNVTTGSGGFSVTAVTMTGSVNVTQAVTSTAVEWKTAATPLTSLTVNGSVEATLADKIYTRKCVNNGTITAGANTFVLWLPTADHFWSGSGTVSGTAPSSGVFLNASRSNAAAFNWPTSPFSVSTNDAAAHILTASGGITCSALAVYGKDLAGQWCGLTLPDGANLSCASVTLGYAGSSRSGRVMLGTGVHRATGAIKVVGDGNAQAITIGGRLILGGVFTGTSITTSVQGDGQIDCFGTGRVTAVTSTGRRLVVRRAVDAAGAPVRSWNGDSCTNVRFLGRKIIGAPGVN